MIVGEIAKHDEIRGRSVPIEAKLLLHRQKTMLQRTLFARSDQI